MAKEIELKVEPEIESKQIEVGEWGLTITGALSLEEWHKALIEVQKYDGKIQWYLGDLVVYAESDPNRWTQGKYDSLIETTGYENQSLRRFASVARRFPKEFRESICAAGGTFGVTFSHFAEVASLKNDIAAKHFLEMVRDSAWTREKLRNEVIKLKNNGILPEKEELPEGYKSFKKEMGAFFKWYTPEIQEGEYDEKTWLLEVRDTIDARLKELGVLNK